MNLAERLSVTGTVQLGAEDRQAIEWAVRVLKREGIAVLLPAAMGVVVWRLLQDAAETLARLPDKERVWLLSAERACWPEVWRSAKERFENAVAQLADLKVSKEEPPLPRLAITDPTAVPRMLAVLDWLQMVRSHSNNHKRIKRDKLVTLALAQGQSAAQVARRLMGDKTPQAASMVRQKVVGQIASELKKLYNIG